MKPIRTFTVVPSLPRALEQLRMLAYNLRWSWHPDTIALFRRLDSDLWETTGHNPAAMLGKVDQEALNAVAVDDGFLAHLDRVTQDLNTYLSTDSTWYRRTHGASHGPLIAYFSTEFGLTECLSIFAGGLGVLAGDHLKSASDLGVPLVGVGLLYQQGYFRQYLDEAGWQREAYENNDFYNLPLTLQKSEDRGPILVDVSYPGSTVKAQIWKAEVGRVELYLLDTNLAANQPRDREITNQLYGGDLENRIKQEFVLGVGGYRALDALGLHPVVYHMNEGHSAFLALERVRQLMEMHGLRFNEALEAASAGLVFTSHTPVQAGHDYFPPELVERYFSDYVRGLGLSMPEFLALGRLDPSDAHEPFCMTILALRGAHSSNGVSQLHGQVSRRMWQELWPGVPEDEVPIGHVTNGVHIPSWVSREMGELYDRYLGPRWREEPADQSVWRYIDRVPAEELWRNHERRRLRLVALVRRTARAQIERRGARRSEIEAADSILDPDALTIGFARRFATYKRATELLRDPDRLSRILNNPDRPVQVIFAGKAHPRDEAGKDLIQEIVTLSRREEFRRRLVFLEDYDTSMARYVVQGADVWLNNPRRPLEASGTSGMKAAANGVLNLSTLDGWWAEAWERMDHRGEPIGWAIGQGETYEDLELQDELEAQALYDLLEREVVPTFYDRGQDGLPRQWITRMKASIGGLCYFFNTHRMVKEYTDRFYKPALVRYRQLSSDNLARARNLAIWKENVRQAWPEIRVEELETDMFTEFPVGGVMRARARVHLGPLNPEDVRVELYLGRVGPSGEIVNPDVVVMNPIKRNRKNEHGTHLFEAEAVSCQKSGLHGYTVRVLPNHPGLSTSFLPDLIRWAEANGVS